MSRTRETCTGCKSSEARCAFLYGACCGRCTHWPHLDARGNDVPVVPSRLTLAACGTQSGYDRHRYRREAVCGPCKVAHGRYVMARRSA